MGRKPEGTAEKAFKRFGKKLDEFMKDIKELSDKSETKYKGEIEEIKRNRDKLVDEIENFRENHKGTIDEVEGKIEEMGHEIGDLFKRAFKSDGKK